MTTEEYRQIAAEAGAAWDAGDREKFLEISKKVPVPPEVAMAFKEGFGADFMINSGFDLSEAEKEYGKDWLSR